MSFGPMELAIILVIVLLLFGSTRLPKLAHSFGHSMRELRDGFFSKEAADKKRESKKETQATPKEDEPIDYYRRKVDYTRR